MIEHKLGGLMFYNKEQNYEQLYKKSIDLICIYEDIMTELNIRICQRCDGQGTVSEEFSTEPDGYLNDVVCPECDGKQYTKKTFVI